MLQHVRARPTTTSTTAAMRIGARAAHNHSLFDLHTMDAEEEETERKKRCTQSSFMDFFSLSSSSSSISSAASSLPNLLDLLDVALPAATIQARGTPIAGGAGGALADSHLPTPGSPAASVPSLSLVDGKAAQTKAALSEATQTAQRNLMKTQLMADKGVKMEEKAAQFSTSLKKLREKQQSSWW